MRPFIPGEVFNPNLISVSPEDINNGSPKPGDMIARNPKNHDDMWLVAKQYFEDNLEEATPNGGFGEAIEALKQGKLVTRNGWNGKGMFIVKQIPSVIGVDIIPRMQSLPQSVKNVFVERDQPISYESQMLIIKSDGSADSWVPSSSDVFAEDWIILDLINNF